MELHAEQKDITICVDVYTAMAFLSPYFLVSDEGLMENDILFATHIHKIIVDINNPYHMCLSRSPGSHNMDSTSTSAMSRLIFRQCQTTFPTFFAHLPSISPSLHRLPHLSLYLLSTLIHLPYIPNLSSQPGSYHADSTKPALFPSLFASISYFFHLSPPRVSVGRQHQNLLHLPSIRVYLTSIPSILHLSPAPCSRRQVTPEPVPSPRLSPEFSHPAPSEAAGFAEGSRRPWQTEPSPPGGGGGGGDGRG